MRRVTTISLNGNAFQLEDDACELLARYLDDAARALAHDPDRAEILSDLEQAIADKCARLLGPHRNVLARADVEKTLDEMGPVEAGDAGPAHGDASADAPASGAGTPPPGQPAGAPGTPRRLYQISEGAVISGLCAGLAAYFGVDVAIVRVAAVLLAFLSGGLVLLAYAVLMFVVPYAHTSEQQAEAHGLPFNARELVEHAKRKYREFARDARGQSRREGGRKAWRRAWRDAQRGVRTGTPAYGTYVATRITAVVLALVLAAFVVGWLALLLSFLSTGQLLGHAAPWHMPGWAVVVALFIVFGTVTSPLRAAVHATAWNGHAPRHGGVFALLEGLVMVIAACALANWAWHHSDEIRQAAGQLGEWLKSISTRSP